jgi:hypothetical protein
MEYAQSMAVEWLLNTPYKTLLYRLQVYGIHPIQCAFKKA